MGLLDGKVAIVTGAGGGLGREHAMALAAEGSYDLAQDHLFALEAQTGLPLPSTR